MDTERQPVGPADAGMPGTPVEMRLRFVGTGSEYFRIWIVNLLLTLVTLGLYYPFAKVRRLRYFHGATEVGGHPMSFHADPWKMLRGYLLMAALMGAYVGAGYFSLTATMVAVALIALLWPALWHSSLRFRLANTGWRGLRFRFTGSARDAYAVMALPTLVALGFVGANLWVDVPVGPGAPPPAGPGPEEAGASWLSLLPLVLAMVLFFTLVPLQLWLLRRYQHGHYALGDERTAFSARLGAFMAIMAKAVLLGIGLMGGLALVVVLLAMLGGMWDGAQGSGLSKALIYVAVVAIMGVGYVALLSTVGAWVATRLQNLVWGHTRSAHLAFASQLRARQLVGLTIRNWLLTILTLGLYHPFAAVATARLRLEAMTVHFTVDPDHLVARAGAAGESAAGDAAGDLLGIDIGL